MDPMNRREDTDSVVTTIGTVAGVASLVLAVAGNNLEKLTNLQKWGLAGMSTVMLLTFLAGLVWRQASIHGNAGRQHRAIATLFVGGLVGCGLLLVVIPFFSFGLPSEQIDTLSVLAACVFGGVTTLISLVAFLRGD